MTDNIVRQFRVFVCQITYIHSFSVSLSVKKVGKVLGIVIAVVMLLMAMCTVLVNTKAVQSRIVNEAVVMISERIGTKVDIDSASVSLFSHSFNLYGLAVEDQKQRKLLQIDELSANVNLWPLLHNRVIVDDIEVKGLDVNIVRSMADSTTNFQFIVDSLKRKSPRRIGKKSKTEVNVSKIELRDIRGRYDRQPRKSAGVLMFNLHQATFEKKQLGRGVIEIDNLNLKTDNERPRKNTGKPHRGYFDVGHMDFLVDMKIDIDSLAADTVVARISSCRIKDDMTGFDIPELKADICVGKTTIDISDIAFRQKTTKITVPEAHFSLPDKRHGRRLSYVAPEIHVRPYLKDISRPFAPVLKNFNIPLNVSTRMEGTDSTIDFRNIRVATDDNRLLIKATGHMSHLKKKHDFRINFHVNSMHAKKGIKEEIINQFPVKKLMMKQLRNLGDISYAGDIFIRWKRENFRGVVHTAGGPLDFDFSIDEKNKYLEGTASTRAYRLGQVLGLPAIGDATLKGNFKIDISKPRTAKMRKEKGGKLPIGTVSANVGECSYSGVKFKNIEAHINSDGALAEGRIENKGKLADLYCSFTFTDTDDLKKMKIVKPGMKLHLGRHRGQAATDAAPKEKKAKKSKPVRDSKQ